MSKDDFSKIYYIEDFINYISKKNYSANTVISYKNDLYYFYMFINKNLLEITEDDIRSYLTSLNKLDEASSSIRRKISSFKSFYKFLYKNDYMKKENYPLTRIAYPKTEKKLPRFIYYNELLEIINEASKDKDSVRDRLIIEMLYATGVRITELINIKISDIDFNNRRIVVLGKGNKERIVYYGEYAEEVLKKYINTHSRIGHNYLFMNSKGEKITDRGVRYIIDNIMKRLSIKTHVSPHVLRHTFATDMLNNGCDIKIVQELLGHTSLRATEIYTHVTNESIKKVYYECFPRREEK